VRVNDEVAGFDDWLVTQIYDTSVAAFKDKGWLAMLYGWRDFGDRMRSGWCETEGPLKMPCFYDDTHLGAHVFSGPGSATGRLCADVGRAAGPLVLSGLSAVMSLGASAVYAVLSLLRKLLASVPLSQSQATLNGSVVPNQAWLDLVYQLVGIGFGVDAAMVGSGPGDCLPVGRGRPLGRAGGAA
jgi:hypothetical protein